MSRLYQEVPAEIVHDHINQLADSNTVLLSIGNINLYNLLISSCRFATGLTFKPIAACFVRPHKHVLRFIENNKYFTLSYFSPENRHVIDKYDSKIGTSVDFLKNNSKPGVTQLGNVYHPQARLVLECRKVSNLELILSSEIQAILSIEKAREIYPGNETPRMFLGEVEHCWMNMQPLLKQ